MSDTVGKLLKEGWKVAKYVFPIIRTPEQIKKMQVGDWLQADDLPYIPDWVDIDRVLSNSDLPYPSEVVKGVQKLAEVINHRANSSEVILEHDVNIPKGIARKKILVPQADLFMHFYHPGKKEEPAPKPAVSKPIAITPAGKRAVANGTLQKSDRLDPGRLRQFAVPLTAAQQSAIFQAKQLKQQRKTFG